MKKIHMFLVLVTLAVAVSTNVVAQKSTILIGDKNNSEVKGSAQNFKDLISAIDCQMRDLKKENTKKINDLERSKKRMLHNPGQNQYLIEKTDYLIKRHESHTDSLMAVYEQKKSQLENELINFTVVAAGKDKQKIYHLQSRDVSKMTKVINTLEYYEAKKNGINNNTAFADSVLIINDWMDDAFVSVSNQTGFCISFKLESKQRQVVAIPGPGDYSVSFRFGGRNKTACTNFDGYTRKGFDRKTQRTYAFMAGLPSKL